MGHTCITSGHNGNCVQMYIGNSQESNHFEDGWLTLRIEIEFGPMLNRFTWFKKCL
jgi:hypothetical protein